MAVKAMKDYDGETPLRRIGPYRCIDGKGNTFRTDAGVKRPGTKGGQPRSFESADDLLDAFKDYLEWLRNNEFQNENGVTIYPGKQKFADFCGIDRKTVYKALTDYYPGCKKDWADALADFLADGVAAGAYQTAFTIFYMKNRCDWTDKQETKLEKKEVRVATREEAAKALQEYAQQAGEKA